MNRYLQSFISLVIFIPALITFSGCGENSSDNGTHHDDNLVPTLSYPYDVHGAGSYGNDPQGDVRRVINCVRCVCES